MGQMGEDIADWKYFLSIISKCTDDYLYIYDLSNDYAVYSSSITKDFELDVAEFSNAGRKLKDVIYPDDYEAVFTVHTDREHMHGHLIWNSVSVTTGKKYNSPKGNWKNHLQPITNKYCKELGLGIIPAE